MRSPWVRAVVPVIRARRAGTQVGVAEYARLKSTPLSHSWSRVGVRIRPWPAAPRSGPGQWSKQKTRTFGLAMEASVVRRPPNVNRRPSRTLGDTGTIALTWRPVHDRREEEDR